MVKRYKVYAHTTPNGKTYIGYTGKSLKSRWQNGNGYKQHKHFYSAIQKYGWDNIKHEILFETDKREEALEKEMEFIALYKSNNRKFGYNNSVGGDSGFNGGKHSKAYIKKLKENKFIANWTKINLSKSVAQYDLFGNFLALYNSISEASLITGISRKTIENGCNNRITKPRNFYWEYCANKTPKEKIDIKQKCKLRKDNLLFSYNGKTQTVRELSVEYGIKYETLLQRLTRGNMPIDIALNKPISFNKISNKSIKERNNNGR